MISRMHAYVRLMISRMHARRYEGVRFELPLTDETIVSLVHSFTCATPAKLHQRYVYDLLLSVYVLAPHALSRMHAYVRLMISRMHAHVPLMISRMHAYVRLMISRMHARRYRQWSCPPPGFEGQCARAVVDLPEPPEGSRMLIVGDTHGQLADVLWMFAECTPSPA